MSWRDRVLTWVEPEDNPSGTIYGTIAAGLIVAAQEPAKETYPRVLVATAVAVASVWLAHGYAHWAGERLRRGGDHDERSSARRLGRTLTNEWPIIEGGAIPLTALLVAWAIGAPLPAAITADLGTAAAALVVFEVAGALRQRLQPLHLLANATVGLVLGLTLFAVKMLLHRPGREGRAAAGAPPTVRSSGLLDRPATLVDDAWPHDRTEGRATGTTLTLDAAAVAVRIGAGTRRIAGSGASRTGRPRRHRGPATVAWLSPQLPCPTRGLNVGSESLRHSSIAIAGNIYGHVDRPEPARARERRRDARHLQPSVARLRRPD